MNSISLRWWEVNREEERNKTFMNLIKVRHLLFQNCNEEFNKEPNKSLDRNKSSYDVFAAQTTDTCKALFEQKKMRSVRRKLNLFKLIGYLDAPVVPGCLQTLKFRVAIPCTCSQLGSFKSTLRSC